ncbi:MAG: hypothetical protein KatS3mg084_0210 [Candidatus Dojkabacteria bacterium]|nr:MAG: hypothetical protein KatS3mg084_0210 [Candidatus Dojkabacteria bacterium]
MKPENEHIKRQDGSTNKPLENPQNRNPNQPYGVDTGSHLIRPQGPEEQGIPKSQVRIIQSIIGLTPWGRSRSPKRLHPSAGTNSQIGNSAEKAEPACSLQDTSLWEWAKEPNKHPLRLLGLSFMAMFMSPFKPGMKVFALGSPEPNRSEWGEWFRIELGGEVLDRRGCFPVSRFVTVMTKHGETQTLWPDMLLMLNLAMAKLYTQIGDQITLPDGNYGKVERFVYDPDSYTIAAVAIQEDGELVLVPV